jgi:hypothetical protein
MRKNMLKYRNTILLVIAFVVGSGAGFYWPTSAQDPTTTRNSQEIPARPSTSVQQLETKNVIFEQQPDSPLQPIEVLAVSYPQQNEVHLILNNVSNKAIRAYVLKKLIYDSPTDQQPLECWSLSTYLNKAFYIAPESPHKDYLTGSEIEAHKVVVAVDYVEFADGTSWGKDARNHKEVLAAKWAAALASTNLLVQMVEKEGLEALKKVGGIEITAQKKYSEEQARHFKYTMYAVQSFVKNEAQENLEAAKDLLQSMHTEYQRIAEQQLAAKEQ